MGQSSVWNGLRPYTGNLRRLLRSTSNGRLLGESIDFARSHAQILVLGATRAAADEFAFRLSSAAGGHPLLLLDPPLSSKAHRDFVGALIARSADVLAVVTTGDEAARAALESAFDCAAEDLDAADSPASGNPLLQHLRRYLFEPEPPP